MKEKLQKAAYLIQEAEALLVMAGAGIGVDSGLPDFRGTEGFWKAYPPLAKLRLSFTQMANPKAFVKNPSLAWAFYGHRLRLYRKTIPHRGFSQLLALGKEKPYGYFVFTSNVDGQFQKAGFDTKKIEECHGSIHHIQCTSSSCNAGIWTADQIEIQLNEECFEAKPPLPKCLTCGQLARPNILMFGDMAWNPDRTEEQSQLFFDWLLNLKNKKVKVVIIEIGAGEDIPTVRWRAQDIANQLLATIIRINPRDYAIGGKHLGLALGAQEAIEKITGFLK